MVLIKLQFLSLNIRQNSCFQETVNFHMVFVTSLVFLLFASSARSQRCYNFSLTVSTELRHRTTNPMWFSINGTSTSYSEWFSISSFPEEGATYEWKQDLNDVGSPTEIVVLSLTEEKDIFGFTSIGVNGIISYFSAVVTLDAYAGVYSIP